MKPKRTTEERAEEEAIRRQYAANLVFKPPGGAINQRSFAAILSLMARFKAVRESQGLTLAEVARRMGIDVPALSRLETGKVLDPRSRRCTNGQRHWGRNWTLILRPHDGLLPDSKHGSGWAFLLLLATLLCYHQIT